MSYQFNVNKKLKDRVLIENVCLNKKYRGFNIFTKIFNWFLIQVKIIYKNYNKKFEGYHLTIWKESPFNLDNKIYKLYQKFNFKYFETEFYSKKRTYIHMIKND